MREYMVLHTHFTTSYIAAYRKSTSAPWTQHTHNFQWFSW